MKKFVMAVVALSLCLVLSVGCAVSVREGNRGVVLKFGKATGDVLQPGWHWTMPFVTSVVQMNVQWQRYEITASAYSKDIQQVDVQLSMSYQLNSEDVLSTYKSIGVKYADQIMLPRAIDAIKAVFARYSAEELIAKRQNISSEIFNLIHEQMLGYGVTVREIALENIDFSDSFEAAVEAKQVATQTALRVKVEQEQETARAEAEAERARIKANADADVKRIEADAEAYRLEMLGKYLTDNVLDKEKIDKWDGKLPTVQGGATPIIDIGEIE